MKRFFWKFFPKKTESMNVFVDFVLRNRCTRVEVAPMTSVLAQLGLPGVSLFVLFSVEMDDIGTAYYVCCTAITSRGEKMVYEYKRVARYVPQREYAADHERCALEIFLEAEQCASLLDYRHRASGASWLIGNAHEQDNARRSASARNVKINGSVKNESA